MYFSIFTGQDTNIEMEITKREEIFFLSDLHYLQFPFLFVIFRGHAKPNETVLIHGASGGVS
jgi:hypothetical protein